LDRIQDVTTEQGFWGGALGYGDVLVTTAGWAASGPARGSSPARVVPPGGRPSLVLSRVRSPDQVAQSLFASGTARRPGRPGSVASENRE
ncbi:MAG: PH domain-containing protein, partial [Candidatus Dormibacteraceae bacterium]